MYPIPGFSVLLAIISFVLVMLTIFAGNKPGFMEDYHVLYFNTSTLGQNMVPSLKARAPIPAPIMPEPTAPPTLLNRFHASAKNGRNILGDVAGGINSVKGGVEDGLSSVTSEAGSAVSSAAGDVSSALSGIENDLADELAKKLGIKEFYSIHLVDLCDGDFKPNATDPDATFNVTNCTTAFDYNMLNISAMLDHELSVGPFSLDLADLGFTQDIQDKLDDIPKVIKAIVAMYIIAAFCIGLTFFASIGAILLIHKSGKIMIMANLGLAGLAVLFLLIGNLITTIGSRVVVKAVTKLGNGIGLYAEQGSKFVALTWATFALMLLSVFYWVYEIMAQKKRNSDFNRAINGDFSGKNENEGSFSRTSSGLASDSDGAFPQNGGYPPTHAPGMPVSSETMHEVPLGGYNYGRGTHEPPPVSPLRQISF